MRPERFDELCRLATMCCDDGAQAHVRSYTLALALEESLNAIEGLRNGWTCDRINFGKRERERVAKMVEGLDLGIVEDLAGNIHACGVLNYITAKIREMGDE